MHGEDSSPGNLNRTRKIARCAARGLNCGLHGLQIWPALVGRGLLLWAVVCHVGLISICGTLGGLFPALDTAEVVQRRSFFPGIYVAAKARAVI